MVVVIFQLLNKIYFFLLKIFQLLIPLALAFFLPSSSASSVATQKEGERNGEEPKTEIFPAVDFFQGKVDKMLTFFTKKCRENEHLRDKHLYIFLPALVKRGWGKGAAP